MTNDSKKLKVYIISYKKPVNNKKVWNPISQKVLKRFREFNFDTEMVEGYNLKENPEIRTTQITYKNFLDKILLPKKNKKKIQKKSLRNKLFSMKIDRIPKILSKKKGIVNFNTNKSLAQKYLDSNKTAKGFFIAEDDAWLNDKYKENNKIIRVDNDFFKKKVKRNGPIVRYGYQKILSEKGLPNGYFCVGAQLTWIPRDKVKKLTELMIKTQPQLINGFFSKTQKIEVENYPQDLKKNKLVHELEHVSATTGKVRKGLSI